MAKGAAGKRSSRGRALESCSCQDCSRAPWEAVSMAGAQGTRRSLELDQRRQSPSSDLCKAGPFLCLL